MTRPFRGRHDEGAVLIVCLLLMLVILMLSTSGAQIAIQEEKASRYERDRLIALLAAEAALKDAEIDVEKTARLSMFVKAEREAGRCEAGLGNPLLGLCFPAAPDMFPVWQRIDAGPKRVSVPFGYFTERSLAAADSALPPAYLIEVLPAADTGTSGEAGRSACRITAIGYGSDERNHVVLQSYLQQLPDGRWQRRGWREIQNWEELREMRSGK